jgi:hypothetical protein
VEGGLIKGVMRNKMGPSSGKIRGKCSKWRTVKPTKKMHSDTRVLVRWGGGKVTNSAIQSTKWIQEIRWGCSYSPQLCRKGVKIGQVYWENVQYYGLLTSPAHRGHWLLCRTCANLICRKVWRVIIHDAVWELKWPNKRTRDLICEK